MPTLLIGKGERKGGAGAKYCTMRPGKCKGQSLGHPWRVKTHGLGIEVLRCVWMLCELSNEGRIVGATNEPRNASKHPSHKIGHLVRWGRQV